MNQLKMELERRKSQTQRILELLQDKTTNTVELQKIAFNYTMRISELRKEGHIIVANYVKPGFYEYSYGGQKDG